MKLIITKKRVLIVVATIIFAGAVLGVCCGVGASTSTFNQGEKVIVIDAGHGGIDAGVIGVATSSKESDINLSISRQLKSYFISAGFKVVMTRTNNGGLYGSSTSGFKKRDMQKRKQIIQENNADMVISVHQNFCPIPSRRGGTVFYDKNSDVSSDLAKCIQKCLNGMDECVSQNTALTGDYFMLKCTKSPSVIVECGFLSNSEDDKLLSTEEYQKKIAYAIFKGAVAYYG